LSLTMPSISDHCQIRPKRDDMSVLAQRLARKNVSRMNYYVSHKTLTQSIN